MACPLLTTMPFVFFYCILLLCGCVADQPDTGGVSELHLAAVNALAEEWDAGDPELTAAYYRANQDVWQFRDLNGDGIDEAICEASMVVFEPGKPRYIGGATGNAPAFIFQRVDGRWHRIADLSGVNYEVLDKNIHGWKVLLSTWHLGGPNTSTAVLVYETDRYKTIHTYEQAWVHE